MRSGWLWKRNIRTRAGSFRILKRRTVRKNQRRSAVNILCTVKITADVRSAIRSATPCKNKRLSRLLNMGFNHRRRFLGDYQHCFSGGIPKKRRLSFWNSRPVLHEHDPFSRHVFKLSRYEFPKPLLQRCRPLSLFRRFPLFRRSS